MMPSGGLFQKSCRASNILQKDRRQIFYIYYYLFDKAKKIIFEYHLIFYFFLEPLKNIVEQ